MTARQHTTNFFFVFILTSFFFHNLSAQLLWSDPATWGGTKPVAGEDVTIPQGVHILLDENTPNLGGLTIHGTLEFDRQNINLTTGWIMVMGRLEVGTEAEPFEQQAIITLTDENTAASIMGMGTRGILVMGGSLELHGTPPAIPWTKINANATAGSTALTLQENVDWAVNDQIAIAPTDYYGAGYGASVTQRVRIASINGTALTLDQGLNAFRWGVLQYATTSGMSLTNTNPVTPPAASGFTPTVLDERAPVGNLTRNIVIQAPDDALWNGQGFGCHIMIMRLGAGMAMCSPKPGSARLDGVEIRRGGQRGLLGRYAFHWHMLSYEGATVLPDVTGQYIRNSVINISQNRGIVIHGTNGVEVQNNVLYNIRGHGIFTEDAVERRNTIDGNLVLHVRNPQLGFALKLHESGAVAERGSSGFWISNPDNIISNNTAADCQTNGFWFAFPTRAWGLSSSVVINPSRIRFGVFDNNTAHSNGLEGIMLDWIEIDSLGTVQPHQYLSTTDGQEPSWPFPTLRRFALERYKTWKNGSRGIWDRAVWADNYEVVSADNCGRFFAGSGMDGVIERSLVVGTSLNHLMNGTDRPNFTGETPPAGFATYHSTFDIRDNIVINFSAISNTMSGVFATDDYYLRPVEKGQLRNVNNLIINSHPGVKLEAAFPHFALAGALWDPHGTWGGDAGDWMVYDTPFFTYGQTPTAVAPGAISGGVLVKGPFYGFNDFVVNQSNDRYEDLMAIQVNRLNSTFQTVGTWTVAEAGHTSWLLAHMRHFAAHHNGYYTLEFPNVAEVNDVGISVTNMLTTNDTLVIAVEYAGTYDITQVYISSDWNYMTPAHTAAAAYAYKQVYQAVGSRAEVIASTGQTYWHDKEANLVWIKLQGGIPQQWSDGDFDPWDDELLYREFYLRVHGSPAPLAVEKLAFSATVYQEDKVQLEWTTASEQNNDYFTIERSLDGQNWHSLLNVKGAGYSTQALKYTAVDEHPFSGLSYYRLRQTDFDGQFQYSQVVSVKIEDKQNFVGEFYPNPSPSGLVYLNYESAIERQLHISIFDASGKLLKRLSQSAPAGSTVLEVDSSDKGNGIYLVKIEDGEKTIIRKLVRSE